MSLRGGKFNKTLGQLTLFALRAGSTGSKFLLAIYTARYLSLADLGIYGLLMAATVIAPAVGGLGLTDWIMRRVVDLPLREAIPIVASRSALTLLVQLIGQPLVFLGFALAGHPLPLSFAVLGGAIVLLETVSTEICDVMVARRHIFLAHWLGFLRQGFWPLPVIALGLLVPKARTLEMLLSIWCAALVLVWIILLLLLLQKGRWRYVRLVPRMLPVALRGSLLLYVKHVSGTVSSFADRFLISLFLGLELSGVYSLYWSMANVVHSLVVIGVLQTHVASLIEAAKERTGAGFRALERRLRREAGAWALVFALVVAIVTPFLISYLGRPLLKEHLPVLWLVLVATVLRIGADGYDYAIYAYHRDRAIATIAVGGALGSALLNVTLAPLMGLWGSALAYTFVSSALLAARYLVTRSASGGQRPAS